MATLDKQVVRIMAEEICRAIKKANEDNNRTYVNAQIANSKSVATQTISGSVSASQVANLPAFIAALIGNAETNAATDPNAQLIYSAISGIADIRVENATITTAQIEDLYASYGEFINLVADKAAIGDLDVEKIYADLAEIGMANIGFADIGFAQIKDLVSNTAIIREGIGGKLYIDRLAVTDAQILSLTTGELIIQGKDGKLYTVYIDDSGEIHTELRVISGLDVGSGAISGDNIAENTITGNLITENAITARELNVSQIFASEALIGAIKAANIDVADLFANNAYIDELTAAIIKSPTIGKDIDISKNSSITLTDERISLIVSSESTSSNVILTDKAIRAIADRITFTANQEITFTVGDAKFSIDAEAFNSLIGDSSNYTSLKQQADSIAVVAVDENGNISSIDFTPHAIMAMSESIILTADKINAIANDIDLSGNHTITFNTEQLKAIANNINLETNVSIRQMVSGRSKIFYQEDMPEEYDPGNLWIIPSTGKTYHAIGLPGGSLTEIVVNDDFEFVFRYPPEAEGLDFLIDQYGDLLTNTEYIQLDEDGTLFAFRAWVEVPVSELHTSYIDIMQDVIRIRSGGNIEIGAGGTFNVDAGSAHFKTSDFALSILAEDGSEDTVLDFDAESKTLRADEVKAGNIRDFFPGTTTVTAAEIGGLDGLAGMLAAAQYEHVVYTQTTSDASSEVIEFNACDSMLVEIEGFTGCIVPPLMFNRLTGRIVLKNFSWNCPEQTAVYADSGNVMLRRCTADAQTGVHATGNANVVWIGDDEAMIAGGACTTAFLSDESADVKLFGLIPSGERTKVLAGTITEINVRTGAGVEVDQPDKTVTIAGTLGYYGTNSGWNGGTMYQGYTSGKGRIYGCMLFDLPEDIAQIKAATLTLYRVSGAGSGSNINVTVYESATEFKSRPSLGDQVAHRDKAAGTGESCTLDVTEGAKALLDGTAKQMVLYTGESAAASGVVYSRHYGKFDSAKLKITY